MLSRVFTYSGVFSFFWVCVAAQVPTDAVEDLRKELESLRAEFEVVRKSYDDRLSKLEEQLEKLQPPARSPDFELPTATETGGTSGPQATPADQVFRGGERTLQALNPEISVTGDVTARYSDDSSDPEFNRINFDGFEMAIQHPLDPFSVAKFFVTVEEDEFALEEGYMSWESLPGRLGLKVGRFHTNFGRLNRFHKHALPWVNRDLPTQTFFGEEGLIGDGVSLSWLPPRLPIAQTNELYFEVINNTNETAFSGKGFGDPVLLGRLLNYYDLTDNAYFEWGVSAATSHWDEEETKRSTVFGLDLSYRWQPLQRALYRSFELRSELFFNDREDWPGGDVFGLYASGEYKLSRSWYAGLRYQYSQQVEDNDRNQWAFSPFLTFWQSEWVRLRAQYDFFRDDETDNANRVILQFTWSLGPHKHEAY